MTRPYFIYLIQLVIVALAFWVIYSLLKTSLGIYYYASSWKIALLFWGMFALYHFGMLRQHKASAQSTIRYFMAATAIKLFLMMILLVGYIAMHRSFAIPFTISFFIAYLFFMVFDISRTYKLMKG
jgi:hypothetical protein